MGILICPICKSELSNNNSNNTLSCVNKHSFDYAKEGYVNLHIGKGSKNSGDDKVMVNSRRDFLNKGFYEPISTKLNEILLNDLLANNNYELSHKRKLLDIGAGEGYYTNKMQEVLKEFEIYALDISKEAVIKGSKSYKNINWIVASGLSQPFKNESFDYLTVLFSKNFPEEFYRILRRNGLLIVVSPNKDHLVDIKKIVYPVVKYENSDPNDELKSRFSLIKRENIVYRSKIIGNDIKNLFNMTPYRWKSPIEGVGRLNELEELIVTVDVNVDIYISKK